MASLTLKSDYSRVPGWKMMIRRAADNGLTHAALKHRKLVDKSCSKSGRFGSSMPGSPPGSRTKWLRNHLTSTPGKNGRSSSGVSKGVKYARVLELGSGVVGPIRAKGKGALAIPINDSARKLSEKGIGPGKLQGVIMLKPRGRSPILIGAKRVKTYTYPGGGKTITRNVEPVWVLKKSVFIKARPFLRPRSKDPAIFAAFHKGAQDYIRDFSRVALGGAR